LKRTKENYLFLVRVFWHTVKFCTSVVIFWRVYNES